MVENNKCKWCGSESLINKGHYWKCKDCGRCTLKIYKFLELSEYNPKLRPMIAKGLNNLPEQPQNIESEKEFYIWLAGIISSDGCIYFASHGGDKNFAKFAVTITSVEKDWIDIIKQKSELYNLNPSIIFTNNIYFLRYPNRKTAFFLYHYTKDWLMPRKMNIIEKYLCSPVISILFKEWKDIGNTLKEEILHEG